MMMNDCSVCLNPKTRKGHIGHQEEYTEGQTSEYLINIQNKSIRNPPKYHPQNVSG